MPHHFRFPIALLACAAACALAGCNWSTTTLAVESTSSQKPDTATADAPATPEPAVTVQAPPSTPDAGTAFKAVDDPKPLEPAPANVLPENSLQPKLTMVNPQQLIGCWKDSFFGTRTLTLNADGTARMVLDLDFAGRLLYGNRLDFDMKWAVEGGAVFIDVLEGKPSRQAKSAMETWGSRYVYLLDNVEDQLIEMRDWDGSMSYTLRRQSDNKASEAK